MILELLGCLGLAWVISSPATGYIAALRESTGGWLRVLVDCVKCLSWWFALTVMMYKISQGARWDEVWMMPPIAYLMAAVWIKLYKRL